MNKRYSVFGKTLGGRPKHDPEPAMIKSKFVQRNHALALHEAAYTGVVLARERFFIEQSRVNSVWKRKLTPETVFTHKGLDLKLKRLFFNEKLFASNPSEKKGVTIRPLIAKCIVWNLLSQKEKVSFSEFSAQVKGKFRKVSGLDYGLSTHSITSVASALIKAGIIQ